REAHRQGRFDLFHSARRSARSRAIAPAKETRVKVIVLGAGAIGAYYGGQLARAGHEVVLYARGANMNAILDRGLEVRTSEGAFSDAGVEARASKNIEIDLWEKFVFIAAMAASCGLARTPIGPLRDKPLGRRLLQRAVQEVIDVARAHRIQLPAEESAEVVGAIDALPPGTKPSFLLDLEAGGPNELD